MVKRVDVYVLLRGLGTIYEGVTRLVLIDHYTADDSYDDVVSRILASRQTKPGTVDWSFTNEDNGDLRITFPSYQVDSTAVSSGQYDPHFAFLDDVNQIVLWVTDETTGAPITAIGQHLTFPSLSYLSKQPA